MLLSPLPSADNEKPEKLTFENPYKLLVDHMKILEASVIDADVELERNRATSTKKYQMENETAILTSFRSTPIPKETSSS